MSGFMSEPLTLAIPSKGRLKEQLVAVLAQSGVTMTQIAGARGYRARVDGMDGIDVMLLSSSEIASALVSGDVQAHEDSINRSVRQPWSAARLW